MNVRIIAPHAEIDAAIKQVRGVFKVRHVSAVRPSRQNPQESMVYIDAVLPAPVGERD